MPPGITLEQYWTLRKALEAIAGETVDLRINENSSTLIAYKGARPGIPKRLSLHRMFVDAPEEIVVALGKYITRSTPAAQQALRQYMNARHDQIRAVARPRTIYLRARGRTYDLNEISRRVNEQFFEGAVETKITWGRGQANRKRLRHITFGTYDARLRLVRIHPILDSPDVPEFFVHFVVYHEMLHAVLDPEHSADGRRYVHTPEFRRREKLHPDYDRCKQFEQEFLKAH